ncbi:MAG: PEP-CTERM sorting domain-containing protein, partial [Verrucomicrobia bacterium]
PLTAGFSMYTAVPEPTSFALAGMGAAALLIFRRRK